MKTVENKLFPFFWQHGEEEEVLVEYVEKIYQTGMQAICVESRPHPDFVGDKWWMDLGIIIRECEKRNMKVWILDDSHFPTGFANGKIKDEHPEYLKQYLAMRRFDIVGPMKGARIDAAQLKGRPWELVQTEIIDIIGVYMAERHSGYNKAGDPIAADTLIDITEAFKEDTIYLDIPVGHWSVFVVFATHEGGEEVTKDYLNPLVTEATQILVDEVYEKHLDRVGQYFGNTITAFFSDEPRFGNIKGTEAVIGKVDMVLPWRLGLENDCHFDKKFLPLLWVPALDEAEREIRYTYMDLVTREYNRNFVKVLADWCQKHGVNYLGHNIEDNGAHARLGYGAGHFFRGQEAQHFSGIDVIGGQIVPGMNYHHDSFQTGGSDGQFFHYALAKLGASAADLYPHKKGRAMCEAFGAYGWNEGLKTMKWIADHLIVRGINYIVPHAFSPKEYPDWDCPPHFYARGNNPQYRYMSKLSDYMNRLMTIFSDGTHKAPVALFYPAEFEWVGDYMPVEIPARALTQSQIDFDIVSCDLLREADLSNGKLTINQHEFEVLVVPYAEYIPIDVMAVLNQVIASGVRVILLEQLPKNHDKFVVQPNVSSVSELAILLDEVAEICLKRPFAELVYYHYQKDGKDYWMFFNESVSETVDVTVQFKCEKRSAIAFDAYANTYHAVDGGRLILEPYQTVVWIFGENKEVFSLPVTTNEEIVCTEWKVSLADARSYPNFTPITKMTELQPLNILDGYDKSSGTVSYQAIVTVDDAENIVGLDLGKAYEAAEVFINRQSAGVKISPPYRFDTTGLFKDGENDLRIEVTNTLGTVFRGGLNQYLTIEPFGLTEGIKLLKS
ncbi:glycosylhydrolase-like jelly roll fold domain-containing protein [Streptococcus sp. S784/96/1]|uniref:glycosylhydrolase-like jelly roll fold domain-containing protein n=1 Tax=Streptococcus sp. S784/96/1 TaxID=2653499 RepID=UPI001386A793|nr:glycosylhydrolase-like jelly roll fold domain-containing protein [Streptococcus sp. S784/96/1]